eukprot:CAMPEP_0174967022 /NCGR_PEP_ID=MMETSP0004_2-20121128/7358_1 /TAXON_ID=420556 /ORGANISM="Ochromonas sp., Strain CCMP1393" /LENGTH=102 /DNA_ID=CAMNT_0016216119 /DNA_START=357 /DNA_END=665 /DNA_ORIENTATION=-
MDSYQQYPRDKGSYAFSTKYYGRALLPLLLLVTQTGHRRTSGAAGWVTGECAQPPPHELDAAACAPPSGCPGNADPLGASGVLHLLHLLLGCSGDPGRQRVR